MTTAMWQSKQVLKSRKEWQKPSWLGNRPKGMSKEDWESDVKGWKLDKLTVLDKLPKTKRESSTKRQDRED